MKKYAEVLGSVISLSNVKKISFVLKELGVDNNDM